MLILYWNGDGEHAGSLNCQIDMYNVHCANVPRLETRLRMLHIMRQASVIVQFLVFQSLPTLPDCLSHFCFRNTAPVQTRVMRYL